MEIFQILFAIAIWILVSWLGARKKASAGRAPDVPPPWEEVEGEEPWQPEAEAPMPRNLRDLVRHLRGEFDVEEAEASEPETPDQAPPPVVFEESLPEPERPAVPVVPRRTRRRPPLAGELMGDLTSGRRSLARAVLLREILGPPVALREPGSDLPGMGG